MDSKYTIKVTIAIDGPNGGASFTCDGTETPCMTQLTLEDIERVASRCIELAHWGVPTEVQVSEERKAWLADYEARKAAETFSEPQQDAA